MTASGPGWISVKDAALAIGRTARDVRYGVDRCNRGATWHGVRLVSRTCRGRGGRAGACILIRVDELIKAFPQSEGDLRALASPAGELISAPTGRPGAVGGGRQRRAIKRADRGGERLLFIRRLCEAAGLPETARAEIADELDGRVKRLWASAASQRGWRAIATDAALDLYTLARGAGADLPEVELRKLCRVPRSYISRWERRKHRKTHVARTDAKAFHDEMPGVRRGRPAGPLEVVFGDGTALDIRFLRPDGSECKVWLILWADAATNRLFGHAYPRPKGEGVRQEHTAASYLVLATSIGLPETLYVDRGGEYRWVKLLGSTRLSRFILAEAYRARSKAIEPINRVFIHHFLSQIPGYIGGDRMRKPTQTVGRPTEPFPGSLQELLAAIGRAIDLYNATPQEGLGNRSPDELWQAAVDRGWQPRRVDIETMTEVLGRKEERAVKRGAVRIDGWDYMSDQLCRVAELEGERVTVYLPLLADFPPAVYAPDGRFVSLVYPLPTYGMTDTAGAREARRLQNLRREGARELERQAPPADLAPYQQRFLELHPLPEHPAGGETVALPGERGRAAAARRVAGGPQQAALAAPEPEAEPDEAAEIAAINDRILGIA